MTNFNCFVTHLRIGGGERSYAAHFTGGAIFAPRLGEIDGTPSIVWDCCFRVAGTTGLPFKRYLTNHGTYAAHVGGSPVTVRLLSSAELAAAEQKIAGWMATTA